MLTGDIRNQIDRVWDAIWTGGITTPLPVIEQISYLLFIRQLDVRHTRNEKMYNLERRFDATVTFDNAVFPAGDYQPDERSSRTWPYQQLRWSVFKNLEPGQMWDVIKNAVFPFIKNKLTDAGVSTAILLFTKTNSGGTDNVWFYDMQADGYSLDDKRSPLGNGRSEPHYFEGSIPWLSSGELEQIYTATSKEHISDEAIRATSVKLVKAGKSVAGHV